LDIFQEWITTDFRDKLSHGIKPEGFRTRPGRLRQNWKDVVKKDFRKMGISWDEVKEAAEDRRSWRNRVAQCVFGAG